MLGALSNPHRLELFVRLASCCAPGTTCELTEGPSACVGELADGLGIAPSTVSHHLKELRSAGIIRTERRGQRVECWIDAEVLKDLAQFFSQQLEDSSSAPRLGRSGRREHGGQKEDSRPDPAGSGGTGSGSTPR